jgi:hypothetical protein
MTHRTDSPEQSIQQAGFLVRPGQPVLMIGQPTWPERLRSASVLKPLLFWAAHSLPPFDGDPARWRRLAMAAVTRSDNAATVEAWRACGGRRLLAALSELTTVTLAQEPGGVRSFGRVLIHAHETATAYARLVESAQPATRRLLDWMRAVPDRQTFGVRAVAAAKLGVDPETVAVKCGWYCAPDEQRLRTHAVTITATGQDTLGTVVLTALPLAERERRSYARKYRGGEGVLPLHESLAGSVLQAATLEVIDRLGAA